MFECHEILSIIAQQMANSYEGLQAAYLFPIVIVLLHGLHSPVVFFWNMH